MSLALAKPGDRGISCTRTLLAALEDIQQAGETPSKPSVLHIVGAASAECELDFEALAAGLAPGAEVVLIGPELRPEEAEDTLLTVETRGGLQISAFPSTYQRYLVSCPDAAAPHFVALFHPGLDMHFFSWYPCLKYWTEMKVPVLVTAYTMPDSVGEKPSTVETLLGALVGADGGAGMWVIEKENQHHADEGAFNSAYFVFLGSKGALPICADEMYTPLYVALKEIKHPFAPPVCYFDIGIEKDRKLLAAIAEGAMRGAKASDAECSDDLAATFAANVLDATLGKGAGDDWRSGTDDRKTCELCGGGFNDAKWHQTICPALGRTPLAAGDNVQFVHLAKADSKCGVLQEFDRAKQRWAVRVDGIQKDILMKSVNLEKMAEA